MLAYVFHDSNIARAPQFCTPRTDFVSAVGRNTADGMQHDGRTVKYLSEALASFEVRAARDMTLHDIITHKPVLGDFGDRVTMDSNLRTILKPAFGDFEVG